MNRMANSKQRNVLKVIVELSRLTIVRYYIAFAILGATGLPCMGAVPLPELVIPAGSGVNIHFTGESRDLDLIAEAGFKFIRMDLMWSGVEREKGIYDFKKAGYDALTKGCIKRGIRILYILDYSNKLYESARSVRTEQGRKAFATFAEAAAKRYAGKGILWEIWNEPNLKHFWSPQPSVEDYCKLVERTAPRIRKVDPTGLVVAPAASGVPLDWLKACFKKGLLKWIDVLSVHPYRSQPPETVFEDYAKLRELIKRYVPQGKEIPIISGEWGYSNINWDKSRLSERQQAHYLARMFLVNLSQGVSVSIWYDWKNDGTNPDEREHNFGTVGHDLRPKAAYLAVKALSSIFTGYSIDKRLELDSTRDFALMLTSDEDRAIALWTIDEAHEVTLPIGPGQGTLIDILGGRGKLSWQVEGLKLTLSQSPQYLLILDDEERKSCIGD